MKKTLAFIFALVCAALLLVACGETSEATELMQVSCADGYENAGFVSFEAETPGTYTFAAQNSDGIEWAVYLFDEEFSDGARYISQAAEPALTEDGSLALEGGEFVYIYCSANAFTDLTPDDNAKLLVTFAE